MRGFIIALACHLLLGACATSTPTTQAFRPDPPSDEFYRDFFESTANRLALNRMNPDRLPKDTSFDQVLLIVDASFDAKIGISLTRDIVDNEFDHFGRCGLEASVWEDVGDKYQKFGDVGEFTSVIRRYAVDVTNADVESVADKLRMSGFYAEKFTDKGDRVCTDGTIYYLEARIGNDHNFIARHTCDNGFKAKIQFADALFALAKDRFPMISERLSQMQNTIQNYPY